MLYIVPSAHPDRVLFYDFGTSAATPLWASLISQINAVFLDQRLPQLGYMNDLLYTAAAIAPASFNDVTMGNNISSYVPGRRESGPMARTSRRPASATTRGRATTWRGAGLAQRGAAGPRAGGIAHEQMYFDSVEDFA